MRLSALTLVLCVGFSATAFGDPPAKAEPLAALPPATDAVPLTRNAGPEYPLVARMKGWEGEALLEAQVTADGTVSGVAIEKSTGYDRLDRAAEDAVLAWKFEPARRDGKAISSVVFVPVRFVLED